MGKTNKILAMALFAAMITAATTLNAQTVRYVKTTANGGAAPSGSTSAAAVNATSWATATSDLQAAINVSSAGDMIYVAEGVYKPLYSADTWNSSTSTYPNTATNINRDNAFVLKTGVRIYGGFKASAPETSPAKRETVTVSGIVQMRWQSILSGDIGTADFDTDNCYHVIIGAGSMVSGADTARLDGFTITKGYADRRLSTNINGLAVSPYYGGGIYNISSSPVLNNVTISGNSSSGQGGGIYNGGSSSPVLNNVTISRNWGDTGGGMYNGASSSPVLTNVTISGNSGHWGGGIYNISSSPALNNVTISGNSASNDGGGIYNGSSSPVLNNVIISGNSGNYGGGMYNVSSSSPVLNNVTVSGNSGNYGGGMYNAASSPVLTNVTISGNSATNNGGGMCNEGNSSPVLINVTLSGNRSSIANGGGMYNGGSSTPQVRNTIIWGNAASGSGNNVYNNSSSDAPTYQYSLVQDINPAGTGNIDGTQAANNPVFVLPEPASSAPTISGYYRPQYGSPALNAGHNTFNNESHDIEGNVRIQEGTIEMGAYEANYNDCSSCM